MNAQNTNINGKFLPAPTVCGILNISRNTVMKIARESDSIYRFGKTVRIDIEKMTNYIEETYRG